LEEPRKFDCRLVRTIFIDWQEPRKFGCQWAIFISNFSGTTEDLEAKDESGNRSNQKSKFDFVATCQCLVKIIPSNLSTSIFI